MADFPNSVKSFATLVDLVDDVLATHQNGRGDEITAIENWLLTGGGSNQTSYRLSVTVVADELIVALKNKNGDDPSSSVPVKVQIGDTVRTITSALSVTIPDGANLFNAGSAELATKEIDYAAYLGYNTTDGVVIGAARIFHAGVYSDFSATTTNEKYCAISTITNAAASDPYVVIGRFAATLSAGAGYTWTVPTFTNANLRHKPIYETRLLEWTPQLTANTGNWTVSAIGFAQYQLVGPQASAWLSVTGETSSTPSRIVASAPFTTTAGNKAFVCQIRDATSGVTIQGSGILSATEIRFQKIDVANFSAGAGRIGLGSLTYPI